MAELNTICFSGVPKSFNHEASMDFSKEGETLVKKHRSLEKKRQPRNRLVTVSKATQQVLVAGTHRHLHRTTATNLKPSLTSSQKLIQIVLN